MTLSLLALRELSGQIRAQGRQLAVGRAQCGGRSLSVWRGPSRGGVRARRAIAQWPSAARATAVRREQSTSRMCDPSELCSREHELELEPSAAALV